MMDDETPRPRAAIVLGEDVSDLSIGDLEERLAALDAEKARIESALASKRADRAKADAVFGG